MSLNDRTSDRSPRAFVRPGPVPPTKWDVLLLLVPLLLLAGAAAGVSTPVPASTGAGVGSLFAAAAVAYGLFVDAPVDPR